MEESEKIGQTLTFTRAKDGNQTFRAGQFADHKLMTGLFQRCEMIQRPLLIGGIAFNGVNNDHSVQVAQHSRSPWRSPRCIQFLVARRLLRQRGIVFGRNFRRGPAGKTTRSLLGCDPPHHIRQSSLRTDRRNGTNRHVHGTRRHLRTVCQLEFTIGVQRRLDGFFDEVNNEPSLFRRSGTSYVTTFNYRSATCGVQE
ncbi:MAG: hypothetical protein WD065_14365 [Planctomycetaceae bacterium]